MRYQNVDRETDIPKPRKVVIGLFVCFFFCTSAFAQDPSFQIVDESGVASWPQFGVSQPRRDPNRAPVAEKWRLELTSFFREDGFFTAEIDSVDWEKGAVFVHKGRQHTIEAVHLVMLPGAKPYGNMSSGAMSSAAILSQAMLSGTTFPQPFTSANSQELIRGVLHRATILGFLGATASVTSITSALIPPQSTPQNGAGWDLTVSVSTGLPFTISSVCIEGDDRTKRDFASRLAGLELNTPAAGFDLNRSARLLRAAGLHAQVGSPRFELSTDSTAFLVIPAIPHSAGDFDLVAGYLPASAGRGAQFVGGGHIKLLNAFGRGRLYSAQIDRFPGQSSGVEIAFRDPYVRMWPVSLQGSFQGYQQDSTFSSVGLQLGLGLHLEKGFEVGVQFSRERTKALQAGLEWVGNEQRIGRTSASFIGVETTYRNLDDASAPRNGLFFKATIETGQKQRTVGRIVEADSLQIKTINQQQRVRFEVRNYISASSQFSVALGFDARLLLAPEIDESELIRFGGAQTLRGYDENQFRGKSTARIFAELRGYVNSNTFGFLFFDYGVIEHAETRVSKGYTSSHPGFGVGFEYESAVGPINISYAMNNEDPLSEGRIHLRLSIGL